MKKLNFISSAPVLILIVGIFAITLSGCFFGEKYEIKSAKVHNPEETSNACAKSLGLNEKDTKQLAKVLKNNGSKLNDEFKLAAMMIITESDSVATEDSDNVEKAYFSCIENSANTKMPK